MSTSPHFTTRRRVLAATGALADVTLIGGRVAFAQPKLDRVIYGQGSIDMFAAVTLLSIVGIALVYCVTWLERLLLHWAPEFRE